MERSNCEIHLGHTDIVAECKDSWLSIVKMKASEFSEKLMDQSDKDKQAVT